MTQIKNVIFVFLLSSLFLAVGCKKGKTKHKKSPTVKVQTASQEEICYGTGDQRVCLKQ